MRKQINKRFELLYSGSKGVIKWSYSKFYFLFLQSISFITQTSHSSYTLLPAPQASCNYLEYCTTSCFANFEINFVVI